MVAALAGTGTPNGTTGKYVTLDSATATPTASKIPIADGSGKLDDGWLNTNIVPYKSLTAGETIAGATLPVAVFQLASDNEIYACDGNDTDKLNFLGFAITDGTDTNTITVQMSGIVSGFTGLTEGVKYYVQDDKTLGTSIGTYELLVGIAISETELLIMHGSDEYLGTDSVAGVESAAVSAVDTSTMPDGANTAILDVMWGDPNVTQDYLGGQLIIKRNGLVTTAKLNYSIAANGGSNITMALSGSTVTITCWYATNHGLSGRVAFTGTINYYN